MNLDSSRLKIPRCYDSHVHWMPTGQLGSFLDLSLLKAPEDVAKLLPKPEHYRGKWLIGFGWNQHNWQEQKFPNKKILDAVFPNTPVYFSRADGHAVWTNSAALKLCGLLETKATDFPDPEGGVILRGSDGHPSGVLLEAAKKLIDQKLPPYSTDQMKSFLLGGMQSFHQAGITHIRDVGGDSSIWNVATELDQKKLLKLAVEMNFTFDHIDELDSTLQICQYAKQHEQAHLRALGIKFFLDGSLGSSTAYLSQNYQGTQTQGVLLRGTKELTEIIQRVWEQKLEVAVHAIGDGAADMIADAAQAVAAKGIKGTLNIEHGEIIRDETITKFAGLDTRIHLQPCHWWSDRHWLKSKLGPLYKNVFPWKKLEEQGVSFFFGSDSPIELPSVYSNFAAIQQAAESEIPAPAQAWELYHQHPDSSWGENSWTEFKDKKPDQVVFEGEAIDI